MKVKGHQDLEYEGFRSGFGLFYRDNDSLLRDLSKRVTAHQSQKFNEKLISCMRYSRAV